jgi:hypothetical protein
MKRLLRKAYLYTKLAFCVAIGKIASALNRVAVAMYRRSMATFEAKK